MNLRKGWNFKGDIAQPLEFYARKALGFHDRPYNTIFDSDSIEMGTFIEVMEFLLEEKGKSDSTFINKIKKYKGQSGKDIEDEIAAEIFEEFEKLYIN